MPYATESATRAVLGEVWGSAVESRSRRVAWRHPGAHRAAGRRRVVAGVPGCAAWRSLAVAIICSGYTDRDMMMKIRGKEGKKPAAFLQKPYRKEELRAASKQVLAAGARLPCSLGSWRTVGA